MKNMNKYELLKQSWLFVTTQKAGRLGKSVLVGQSCFLKGSGFQPLVPCRSMSSTAL